MRSNGTLAKRILTMRCKYDFGKTEKKSHGDAKKARRTITEFSLTFPKVDIIKLTFN